MSILDGFSVRRAANDSTTSAPREPDTSPRLVAWMMGLITMLVTATLCALLVGCGGGDPEDEPQADNDKRIRCTAEQSRDCK